MKVNYWLYKDEFEAHKGAIGTEQEVEMGIMDDNLKVWTQARVQILDQPVGGSEPVGLMGPLGTPYAEGEYHIKIVKILPSPLDEE